MLMLGVTGLVYHAFSEKDFQFRRLYGALAVLLAIVAGFLRLAPATAGGVGGNFLPYGALRAVFDARFLVVVHQE